MKNPLAKLINLKTGEPYDIYIGRGKCPVTGKESIWGNPYSHKQNSIAKYKVKSRKEAIKMYREYILNSPELLAKIPELKGKILGCFCKPMACHGDVLLELINDLKYKDPFRNE